MYLKFNGPAIRCIELHKRRQNPRRFLSFPSRSLICLLSCQLIEQFWYGLKLNFVESEKGSKAKTGIICPNDPQNFFTSNHSHILKRCGNKRIKEVKRFDSAIRLFSFQNVYQLLFTPFFFRRIKYFANKSMESETFFLSQGKSLRKQ